jgi:hypothetical protein
MTLSAKNILSTFALAALTTVPAFLMGGLAYTASQADMPSALAMPVVQRLALQGSTGNPFAVRTVTPTAGAPVSVSGLEIAKKYEKYGTYMGIYEPKDETGKSLGKTYYLFAADQLEGVRTFNETVEYLGTLKDGFKVENPVSYAKELEQALANGSIEGKLFIPSLDIVNGMNPNKLNGKKIRAKNMYDLKDQGDFKGSYALTASDNAGYVLSSSPYPDNPYGVRIAAFSDSRVGWYFGDYDRFSGRPVRVVEVNHLTL